MCTILKFKSFNGVRVGGWVGSTRVRVLISLEEAREQRTARSLEYITVRYVNRPLIMVINRPRLFCIHSSLTLTRIRLESRFWDTLLRIRAVCSHNGTAVLKGVNRFRTNNKIEKNLDGLD